MNHRASGPRRLPAGLELWLSLAMGQLQMCLRFHLQRLAAG